uniref:BED-type domain-containing protein n=1 Tax=Anopheles melas TaxID=34690 RepID=A0A182THK3_9DIPT
MAIDTHRNANEIFLKYSMPNTLKSNAIVWHHFSKDPQEKRGKCLHCGQLISYEKSTLSNLRRHLYRKHEEVLRQERDTDTFECVPVHYVWEHFIKQPEEKAKCVYCYSVLGCPKNVVGNLIRHLKSRHPSLVLEQERGQEALYEEVSRTQYHAESIEDSLGTSTSMQELELELDADLFSTEVHPIDGTNLPSSVKIELVHPDTESCPDDADQEVIEEEIINESQQDVEINCEEMDASSQYVGHVHHPEETLSSQTMEESIVRTSTLQGDSKELELNESPRRQDNFFSIGMKDISMKTAIYATNVAMELECLPLRQRIFAQKLIADVMFHAKLENLTEYAMILGKVNRPFDV